MRKKLLRLVLLGFTGLLTMNSCTSDHLGPDAKLEAELRAIEDDFFNLFKHESAQKMPENVNEENALKTVFTAVASQFFIAETYGVWDTYAPIIMSWNLSDDLYFAAGGTRSTATRAEPTYEIASRAADDYTHYADAYREMVINIYDHNKNNFHSVDHDEKVFADLTVFLRPKDIGFSASTARNNMAAIKPDIDYILANRESGITRPFEDCFSMEDAYWGMVDKKGRGQRKTFEAMRYAIESFMGIPSQAERELWFDNIIAQINDPANNYFGTVVDAADLDNLVRSLSVGVYAASFWKVHYGVERDASIPDPEISVKRIAGTTSVDAYGGELVYAITSNGDWIFNSFNNRDDEVATADPSFGIAVDNNPRNDTVSITFPRNDTDRSRVFTLEFTCSIQGMDVVKQVRINQKAFANADIEINFGGTETIPNQDTIINHGAQTLAIKVYSNFDWEHRLLTTAEPLPVVTPGSGSSNTTSVTVDIPENTTLESRTFEIEFNTVSENGTISADTLRVIQQGAIPEIKALLIDGSSTVGPDQTTLTYRVTSDYDWQYDHISVTDAGPVATPSTGPAGVTDVMVVIPQNKGTSQKSYSLRFSCWRDGQMVASDIVTVTQRVYPAPQISVELLDGSSGAVPSDRFGTVRARVTSNHPWMYDVTFDGSWVSPNRGPADEPTDVEITVVPNFGSVARDMEIIFIAKSPTGATKETRVKIYQTLGENYSPYVNLPSATQMVVFQKEGGTRSVQIQSNTYWNVDTGRFVALDGGPTGSYTHMYSMPEYLGWYSNYTISPDAAVKNSSISITTPVNNTNLPRVGAMSFVGYDYELKRSLEGCLPFFQHGIAPEISVTFQNKYDDFWEVDVKCPDWLSWEADLSQFIYGIAPYFPEPLRGNKIFGFNTGRSPGDDRIYLATASVKFFFQHLGYKVDYGTKSKQIGH